MFHMLLEIAVDSVGRGPPCFQSSKAASTTITMSEKETGKGKV